MPVPKILIYCSLSACLGCQPGVNLPPLTQITGTVTYNGEPIQEGTIVFYPETGTSASGEIADGQITKVMTANHEGVPVGELKVAIISLEPPDENDPMAPRKSLIPEKYALPATSPETVTTAAGTINEIEIDLTD